MIDTTENNPKFKNYVKVLDFSVITGILSVIAKSLMEQTET